MRAVASDSLDPTWTVARQAPLSMWILQARILELPCPPPGDLSDPGIKLVSPENPALLADSSLLSQWGSPELAQETTKWNALFHHS